jgi:hypothetical protein
MEQRQAGPGEYFVNQGVALLAFLLFVRPVVELDARERRQIVGAHKQEIDVLAVDAVVRRLAGVALWKWCGSDLSEGSGESDW